MKMLRFLFTVSVLTCLHGHVYAQKPANDTIPSAIKGKDASGFNVADSVTPGKKRNPRVAKKTDSPYKLDSATRRVHDPRKATLYSTFFPGLGQIYNHKYWKLPLVYAAVGIPAYTYFYNRDWYRKCQYALSVIVTGTKNADSLARVDPKLKVFVDAGDDSGVRSYRNEYRKDQDYSVIFFILFWGLQIVDATVDAHLMHFDITDQLSLHFREASPIVATGAYSLGTPIGLGMVFDIHKARPKLYPTR